MPAYNPHALYCKRQGLQSRSLSQCTYIHVRGKKHTLAMCVSVSECMYVLVLSQAYAL